MEYWADMPPGNDLGHVLNLFIMFFVFVCFRYIFMT